MTPHEWGGLLQRQKPEPGLNGGPDQHGCRRPREIACSGRAAPITAAVSGSTSPAKASRRATGRANCHSVITGASSSWCYGPDRRPNPMIAAIRVVTLVTRKTLDSDWAKTSRWMRW